jgi:hypothetical protein
MPIIVNQGIVMESKLLLNNQLISDIHEKEVITKQKGLWQADRDAWSNDQPATAFLAQQLDIELVPASNVATAATDGRGLYVNPYWSASLDETTRRFTQAHLVWHCAARHFSPAPGLDSRRWHLTCDHEVNVVLLMLGFVMPPQAVLFPACIGKSLPDIYAWLADYPLLDEEVSLDAPPWQTSSKKYGEDKTTSFAVRSLEKHWQEQACEVKHNYVGTPDLRFLMASWHTKR